MYTDKSELVHVLKELAVSDIHKVLEIQWTNNHHSRWDGCRLNYYVYILDSIRHAKILAMF